jgi:hypothetical protein
VSKHHGLSLKKSMAREEHQGRGKCAICGEPAMSINRVTVGTENQSQWLCEAHRKEFAPRPWESRRPT